MLEEPTQEGDIKAEEAVPDAVDAAEDIKDAAVVPVAKQDHPPSLFKGDAADMNGHVYQTFNESDDKRQFRKTTEALGRWINLHTKNSGDLMVLYTDLQEPVIEKPKNISAADKNNPIEELLWK
jgi:hypothetical protein